MENSLKEKAILIGRISTIDYFAIKSLLWFSKGNFFVRFIR
jgi:hypothetical protein